MKRFYLAGQTNFGNRGCEALVRSTVLMLNEQFGTCEFLVPTFNAGADRKQWPEHTEQGVKFIEVPEFPKKLKVFARLNRLFPSSKKYWLPTKFVPDAKTIGYLKLCDAVIMIGGDVISLDYDVAPLLWNTGIAEYALDLKKPVVLWAASVGPFAKIKAVETYMADLLKRLTFVTVRETYTLSYLRSIGVAKNVTLVADPAFLLGKQGCTDISWPEDGGQGVLGFNISPLIQKFRESGEAPSVLQQEVASFIRDSVENKGFGVLLVPHVDTLDGAVEGNNQDSSYLRNIKNMLLDLNNKVVLLPSTMNACQLKEVIGNCRVFIGGRTHSTIAAISSCVPTLSIAYSVKAKGLNHDIFGDIRYVLETPNVGRESLMTGLSKLISEEESIRDTLGKKMPVWRENAKASARQLKIILG